MTVCVKPLISNFQMENSMSTKDNDESGWYQVPDSAQERFWDGANWTQAYRPVLGQSASAAPPFPTKTQAPREGLAIASMVLGIVSLVIWYVGLVTGTIGLVLGLKALKYCQPQGVKRGRGMAKAGIICSTVALSLWGLVILVGIIAASVS
jgi:hypothetical protein|tara:strand:- start:467 stop:919 length:453 start_codon:yes stop_codon:yes gene_type:complete